MLRKIGFTLATFLLLSPIAGAVQRTDPRLDKFKQELMPKVGKTISITGVLESAKLGWLVVYDGWGVYIYSTRAQDVAKMRALDRFHKRAVHVTGTLRYFPQPKQPATDVVEAVPPEHFYFDVAEASVEDVPAQRSTVIRETFRKPVVVSQAPAASISAFRQFFSYVQKPDSSIVKDEVAQSRWLTKNLRDALRKKVASFKDQPEDPDFPSNSTFIGTWDNPSTFTIIGSRRYDKRAVIDVWYEWGKETNYPGDTRLSLFVFMFEDGAWKLDDVYTFRGEFASAESLNFYLRSK